MNKVAKIIGLIVGVVILGVACLLSYVKFVLPNVDPAPDITVELTPERIERGKYLANHVTVCIDCHSSRDWTKYSGPPIEGTFGKGGELFDQKFQFPGAYYSRNITPFNLKDWSDGEIYRAITVGVNKHGKALFPVMPFKYYGRLADEDVKSIIAYIRTLPEINNTPPESVSDFPMNFIINTLPQKQEQMELPSKANKLEYGKYMVNASGCIECHTPVNDKAEFLEGKEFSGGRTFPFPDGSVVRSANITPDEETGIGGWSSEKFVYTFKSKLDSTYTSMRIRPGEYNTIMPWMMYAGMEQEDLEAIFVYLKSLEPKKSQIVKYTPAQK